MREVADETTGIVSREVIETKQSGKSANLRPRITMRDAEGEVLTLSNGMEARYFLPVGAILYVENGGKVNAGDVVARIQRA